MFGRQTKKELLDKIAELEAEAKKKVGEQILDAFKQTDKAKRASRLNSAVGAINRL